MTTSIFSKVFHILGFFLEMFRARDHILSRRLLDARLISFEIRKTLWIFSFFFLTDDLTSKARATTVKFYVLILLPPRRITVLPSRKQ